MQIIYFLTRKRPPVMHVRHLHCDVHIAAENKDTLPTFGSLASLSIAMAFSPITHQLAILCYNKSSKPPFFIPVRLFDHSRVGPTRYFALNVPGTSRRTYQVLHVGRTTYFTSDVSIWYRIEYRRYIIHTRYFTSAVGLPDTSRRTYDRVGRTTVPDTSHRTYQELRV